MASWKWPNVLNKMLSDIPGINVLLNALLKQDVTGTTDVPAGAKQWVDTPEGKQFQVFNGQSWSSVGKLDHDAASVDGYDASPTVLKNTIPVRDANGDLPGNITGNAKTATKAGALSAVNPVEMGGTGANTPEGARGNLGVPPTDHSSTGMDYGLGNATEYGHNKLSDATDSDLGADGGTAATPLAVKTAKAEAITAAATQASSALEAFAETQTAKDDEQDAKIAEALDKVGLPLGFEYVRLTGQTAPLGGVDYMGQVATRAMYADLLAWQRANKPESFVTEARWQELYASQNGNVPFYSEGDGSTTFRFPRVVGYFKGAGSTDELGQYIKEGLPGHTHTRGTMNITGTMDLNADRNIFNGNPQGAFFRQSSGGRYWAQMSSSTNAMGDVGFDASRSWTGETSQPTNSIYSASDHVTPETVTVVMGVVAFGSVASIGEATEEGIVAELGEHGAELGEHGAKLSELEAEVRVKADADVDGKSVVRSVNGVSADAAGNVAVTDVMLPNYSAGVAISSGAKAPFSGFLYVRSAWMYATSATVTIGGVTFTLGNGTHDGSLSWSMGFFVKKNTQVSYAQISSAVMYPIGV